MTTSPIDFIRQTLKVGTVYYYNSDSLVGTNEPHYYVVISSHDEQMIILVCSTTQIEKRERMAEKNDWPKDTLVRVSPQQAPFLKSDSLFDCNFARVETINSLANIHAKKSISVRGQADAVIIKRLINGVIKSPRIEQKIQDLLR